MTAPTKAEVQRALVEAWKALTSAVDSFSDEELKSPGVFERWSMKDVLGHIAYWAQQGVENLQLIAVGRADEISRPGDERTTAEWNEREWRVRKDWPLLVIREEWLGSFEAAREALRNFPPERLGEQIQGLTALTLFAQDTYAHYREHLEHIRAWRRRLDTTGT